MAWSGVVWCGVARCGAVRSGVVPVAGDGRRWVFGGFLVGVGVLSAGGRAITFRKKIWNRASGSGIESRTSSKM